MDHQADFKLLVLDRLGGEAAQSIEWSGPRLICIANDFKKWDEHAVKQMNRNIDLIRYRLFSNDLLLLEGLTATSGNPTVKPSGTTVTKGQANYKTITEVLSQAPENLNDLFEGVREVLLGTGDDVQEKVLKFYFAYQRIKNFACVELRLKSKRILLFLKVDPDSLTLENGFTRDVRNIGHYGTGDLEVTINCADDIEKARPLIEQSYTAS
jgi:predicted transport protein